MENLFDGAQHYFPREEVAVLHIRAQNHDIRRLVVARFVREFVCGDVNRGNVGALHLVGNKAAVDDDKSAGTHLVFEFVKARFVHCDKRVGHRDDGRRDFRIVNDNAAIRRTAAHFGTVRRKPGYRFVFV